MRHGLMVFLLLPLFALSVNAEENSERTPQDEAKQRETERIVEKMKQERATRPDVATQPAHTAGKKEDANGRMARLKAESEASGGTEAERIARYKAAQAKAEADDKAQEERRAAEKAKPQISEGKKPELIKPEDAKPIVRKSDE